MISSISRNRLAPLIEVVDETGQVVVPERVDIRLAVEAENLSEVYEIQPLQGQGWGDLGYKYLGDARHWWVIAELSKVVDPFTELSIEKPLTSTTQEVLFTEILES